MTISDAILHIRYTARDDAAALAGPATKELAQGLRDDAGSTPLMMLLSLRHDFPTEWAAFTSGKGDLSIPIRKNLFPYLAQTGPVTIDRLTLFARDRKAHSRRPNGFRLVEGPTGRRREMWKGRKPEPSISAIVGPWLRTRMKDEQR